MKHSINREIYHSRHIDHGRVGMCVGDRVYVVYEHYWLIFESIVGVYNKLTEAEDAIAHKESGEV